MTPKRNLFYTLNLKQAAHMESILRAFQILGEKKYIRGALEHKEDLTKKTTLEILTEIRGEAIDLFVYAQTGIQRELRRWEMKRMDIKVPPHKKAKR